MKNEFDFWMREGETENEFRMQCTIDESNPDFETEIEYLLNVFKSFLKTISYSETTISRIQYLDDDEWKYVLKNYNEWSADKQEIYDMKKRTKECQTSTN